MEKKIIEFITTVCPYSKLEIRFAYGVYEIACNTPTETTKGVGATLLDALMSLLINLKPTLNKADVDYLLSLNLDKDIKPPKEKETPDRELSKEELLQLKELQIVKEHILQLSDGICSFFDHARIHDLSTGKDYYINWEEAELMFKLIPAYHKTQLKRLGIDIDEKSVKED